MKKEIIINSSPHEIRIAILEDGELVELLVERADAKRIVGNVYKGKVTSVKPGLQAAFVDIGLEQGRLPARLATWTTTTARTRTTTATSRRRPADAGAAAAIRVPDIGTVAEGGRRHPRPGHQGAHQHQGAAPDRRHQPARPLPGDDAQGPPHRRLAQDRGPPRARAPQAAPAEAPAGRGRLHHPHRGRGRRRGRHQAGRATTSASLLARDPRDGRGGRRRRPWCTRTWAWWWA